MGRVYSTHGVKRNAYRIFEEKPEGKTKTTYTQMRV
jgi:hypothetical protein